MTAQRPLVPGVYDAPVTAALQGSQSSLPPEPHETEALDPADSPRGLVRLIHARLVRALATCTVDEILAGIDERSDKGGVKRIQTGVFHVPRRSTDLLFITLEKSEKHYTPTTLYDDYPISPTRFHWESQSIAHEDAPTGRRYISARRGAKNNVLLFVRQRRSGDRGETMPYVHLGRGFYRSHRGARPMQIE